MRHLVLNSWGLSLLLATPAVAHQVQVSEAVGATLHIEPNDVARAGEPTQLWFALVHRGGKPIPLADCQCQLTLYDQGGQALLTPSLRPLSVEDYEATASATLTFPAVGSYELVLEGQAQDPGAFPPFELTFAVTVATAVTPASPAPSSTTPESPSTASGPPISLGVALLLVILGGVAWTWARSRRHSKNKDL